MDKACNSFCILQNGPSFPSSVIRTNIAGFTVKSGLPSGVSKLRVFATAFHVPVSAVFTSLYS
jgi:hypothetical protein